MADVTIIQDTREHTHIWEIKKFNNYLKLNYSERESLHFETPFTSLSTKSEVTLDFFWFPARKPDEKYWFSYRVYNKMLKDYYIAQIKFYILKPNKEKYGEKELTMRETFKECCVEEFFDNITFIEKADELLPNNTLTLGCDIICHDYTNSLRYERSFIRSQLDKQLSDILINIVNEPDLKIIVEGDEFDIHMQILQARSEVFKEMFQSERAEGEDPEELTINNARSEIFKKMLIFIYTNEVDNKMDKEDTLDLLLAAQKYKLSQLKEICGELLFKMVNVDNAMEMYSLAKSHNISELESTIKHYIKAFKTEIRKTIDPEYFFIYPQHLNLLIV